jgi:cobalamin 5'-phosphate synthase/cobalamin synthase
MRNIFKGFALAVSMLTIIPFFKVHDFYKGINGYAVMFYPLVGFLLGAILYFTYTFLHPFVPATHLAIFIFALWILLSGALHLDGFSDTIDGLYVKKEKALQVMKDPNTGGMGMIFSVTFLILKASTLLHFEAFYLLPLVLMLSRLNTVITIYSYPYVSPNGMGSLAKEELNKTQLFVAVFYSTILVAIFSQWILLISSLLILMFLKSFFIKRYGGFTGDIYGFSIEVTELILLNIILVGTFR